MSALFVLPRLGLPYSRDPGPSRDCVPCGLLPALLLLRHGYVFNVPHMPAISAAQGALIPIGAIALYRLRGEVGVPSFLDT